MTLQGFFKFGFYEIFKDLYSNMAGQENAAQYKGLVWISYWQPI